MTTELEKTQLEIARLQLEQEKHKLAQLQKRQKVVEGLGTGAAAVGGAAAKGSFALGKWVLKVLVAWGAILAFLTYGRIRSHEVPTGDFTYQFGFAAGSLTATEILIALVVALLAGFAKWRKK